MTNLMDKEKTLLSLAHSLLCIYVQLEQEGKMGLRKQLNHLLGSTQALDKLNLSAKWKFLHSTGNKQLF